MNPTKANRCLETICVQNRQIINLAYHQQRLDNTRRALWDCTDQLSLAMVPIPPYITDAQHKLRIVYDQQIRDVQWTLHNPRSIKTVQLVEGAGLAYPYKFEDRQSLQVLFDQRDRADEIIILQHGLVTDSFYGNLAFSNGLQWYTPSDFLLPGTQRAHLIDVGILTEKRITKAQIGLYSHFRIINALNDWESAPILPITAILGL